MELGITEERKPDELFSVGDVVGKKITDKLWITDRRDISVGKTVKSCSAPTRARAHIYISMKSYFVMILLWFIIKALFYLN
jgi:hypothetical protein